MILDGQLKFSDSQAVTAAAASTNTIDLSQANRDLGTGESLYVVVSCEVTMDDTGDNSTLDVILYGDSTESFTPDAQQTLFNFPALTAAGTTKIARLDPGSAPLQYQYIQLYYSPVNGDLSSGTFSACLTKNIDQYVYQASGFTIS